VYNLPALWQMLQPEDVATGMDRVLAWDGLATAVREQRRRLVATGEHLAAAWPPEQNASARHFLDQIDDLAASMQETLTRAEDIRAGLRGVVEALDEAKRTMRDLAAGRATVSDDWIPRFVDHAEDGFDERAQRVMARAEAAIADHSTQINPPRLYAMKHDPGISGGTPVRAKPTPVSVPHDPVALEKDRKIDNGPELSSVAPARAPVPGVVLGQPAPIVPAGEALPGVVIGGLLPAPSGGRRAAAQPRPPSDAAGRAANAGRAAGAGHPLPSGLVLGQRTPSPEDATIGGGEADVRWATETGVAPVIVPDARPVRHDPGPGVIGIDR
jgi:hypothetical protein